MIPIGDMVSNGLGFLKELFGWKREDANRKNAPDIKQSEEAKSDSGQIDEARTEVQKGDADTIRKELS